MEGGPSPGSVLGASWMAAASMQPAQVDPEWEHGSWVAHAAVIQLFPTSCYL